MAKLELEYIVRRSPESIRRWWLEFPDTYVAKDPREQPHRIVTRSRSDREIHVTTFWRAPFGEAKTDEVLRLRSDGSWTADTRFLGFHVHDEFRATVEGAGTRLRIESTLTPANSATRVLRPLLLPMMRRNFTKVWDDAAALCERDAP